MNLGNIKDAHTIARRFMQSCDVAIKRIEAEAGTSKPDNTYSLICGSKETAACRRASMDLTRILATLRKPS